MRQLVLVLGCILMMSSVTFGEMEKVAMPNDRRLSLHWWPILSAPPGWYHDRDMSLQLGVNAFVPLGSTFVNAETIMYAKAVYMPREPGAKSLAAFIKSDQKEFLAHRPGIVVKAAAAVLTGDGASLKSFTFFPASTGNWERVAYGEEGEYYLVFAVSSRSLRDYRACVKSFERMVGGYKAKP